MDTEKVGVEKLFKMIDVNVNLTEVKIPALFIECKRNEKRLPESIVMLSRASDAKFTGKEIIQIVDTIDNEIGRLLTVKNNVLGSFQEAIADQEDEKELDLISQP